MIDLEEKRQFIWELFEKYIIPKNRPDLTARYKECIESKTDDWVEKAFEMKSPHFGVRIEP